MGGSRKLRKKYTNPKKPWEGTRIEAEKKMEEQYGLKNKHEIRIAQAELRKIRGLAREHLSKGAEGAEKGKMILKRLIKLGVATEKTTLDDLLALDVHSILGRRLQTVVQKKGLARSARQARQFIAHGHIAVSGKRVTSPSYMVGVDEELNVSYYSDFNPQAERSAPVKETKEVKEEEVKEGETDGGQEK